MNPINIVKESVNAVTRSGGKSVLLLKKFSPEILTGVGIAGVVTAAVMACKATKKVEDATYDHKNEIMLANQVQDSYNKKDINKLKAKAYAGLALDYTKLYGPSVLMGTASIACILGGHGILKKRNAAIAAAYSLVQGRLEEYRGRIRDEFGEDREKQLYFGTHTEEIEVEETNDKGKTKKVKKQVEMSGPNGMSIYAKCFDDASNAWVPVPEYNLIFLKNQQNYFNDLLRSRGHVMLNEVYDALGLPRTKEGCVVGWILGPDGDDFIDFGMYDVTNRSAADFINGYENSIWLDFNVQGLVYDLI